MPNVQHIHFTWKKYIGKGTSVLLFSLLFYIILWNLRVSVSTTETFSSYGVHQSTPTKKYLVGGGSQRGMGYIVHKI